MSNTAMSTLIQSRRIIRAGLLVICAALCGRAQEKLEFHSCTAQAGYGTGWTKGRDANTLHSNGGVFQAGGGFATGKRFAIIGDFMRASVAVKSEALAVQSGSPPSATARFYTTMLEPTYLAYAGRRWNLYALGGFGWFRRSIKFTGPTANLLLHPGDSAIGSPVSANSGAFDAGGGVNFRVNGAGLRVYAEARYLRGLAVNRRSTLVPLTFGIRW
jgi:hypothetical protein